ncbi:MAG: hypothetical protein IJN05_03545, partial [Ruminococcus sp.]|nr:hypothetical protein [Ruminococcus sp.]
MNLLCRSYASGHCRGFAHRNRFKEPLIKSLHDPLTVTNFRASEAMAAPLISDFLILKGMVITMITANKITFEKFSEKHIDDAV